MTPQEVQNYLASLGPQQGSEEGLLFGDPQQTVTGIQVCWMATVEAIQAAAAAGVNLIIAHEDLFHPYGVLQKGGTGDFLTWRTNLRRAEGLARHGIALIRAHGTLDQVCIFDDFAARLELPEASVAEGLVKVYDLEPTTYGALIEHVKRCVGMAAVRATPGDPERVVRRVGLPWGGLGLFVNVGYMQALVRHNCEVFIAGESDNYGFRFAMEAGIELIETSHEVSENPGLKHFSEMLQAQFPNVPVTFYENRVAWRFA